MITKDISLTDCILDLVENAIDGARRAVGSGPAVSFAGYKVAITVSADKFSIADNCGGIRLSDAIDYAFHFGRRADAPDDVKGGIGLYGIGMKRAMFKIGRLATVTSHADDESFQVVVNVDQWKKSEENWNFEYLEVDRLSKRGTHIEIGRLNSGVSEAFTDNVFINELTKIISRDYAFLLDKGLEILVGDTYPTSLVHYHSE